MSNQAWNIGKNVPINSSNDWMHARFFDDDEMYVKYSDMWLENHKCTFPISMLSSSKALIEGDWNPCMDTVRFKVPFENGVPWHRYSHNQRFKSDKTPQSTTKEYKLYYGLWQQYKLDKYLWKCADTGTYKQMLDEVSMTDLNDELLHLLMQEIYRLNNTFCSCSAPSFNDPANGLYVQQGSDTLTSYYNEVKVSYEANCYPDANWTVILPTCYKNILLQDEQIQNLYTDCCQVAPPSLTGQMPDMLMSNSPVGVNYVFLQEAFFDSVEINENFIAYKIPFFNTDAVLYYPHMMDISVIGDQEYTTGDFHRRIFVYSMNIIREEWFKTDWLIFDKRTFQGLADLGLGPTPPASAS